MFWCCSTYWCPASYPPISTLCTFLWLFHFLRRTAESAFVHRYGASKVPLFECLGEYLYYWLFALTNAWWSSESLVAARSTSTLSLGLALFFLGELGNAYHHVLLRGLKQSPDSERQLPMGGLFHLVACPHYTFEIISWIGYATVSPTIPAFAFVLASSGILFTYAKARHEGYVETFKEKYPETRKVLIPFVL